MKKYSLFHIEGGLGKHVAATAVALCIKNNHPDRELIVVCAYPEIFLNLGFVSRVYRIGSTPYFYEDYIRDKDTKIFKHEPYFTDDHIHQRSSLIQSWCKLYELNYSGESPQLVFNVRQLQLGAKRWRREKPVFLMHTNGGPLKDQPYPYSWTRDMPMPLAIEIARVFAKDYHIIQICRDTAQAIDGIESISAPFSNMELFSLLLHSQKRLMIDSCLQHAAAALNLPSTVLWIGTSSKTFGYEMHQNFHATLPTSAKLPDSYLFDYNFHGMVHECPLLDLNLFNVQEIINSL